MIEIKALTVERYKVKVKEAKKEHTYSVLSETLMDLNLFKPRTLTEEEFQSLKKAAMLDDLKDKAIYFISFQARLSSEVQDFLKKKGASNKQVNDLLEEFKKSNLLNDEAYVSSYIDSAINYDYDGPYKVRDKLLKKGAASDIVHQYLDKYTREIEREKLVYLVEKECQYKIKKPLQKTLSSLKHKYQTKGFHLDVVDDVLDQYKEDLRMQIDEEYLLEEEIKKLPKKMFLKENRQKLVAKLMRKGYSYSLIKEIVKGGDFDEDIQ